MRRVRIQQIVLFVLRTAILLLAVLAFARPISRVSGRGDIGAHYRTSVILLIDNSLSTSYVTDRGPIFDRIIARANRILDYLKEGDEAAVFFLDAPDPRAGFTQTFGEWKALLAAAKPSYGCSRMEEALFWASKCAATARNPNVEVYLLSDLQKSDIGNVPPVSGWPETASGIIISFAIPERSNMSVGKPRFVQRMVEAGKSMDVTVTVSNQGSSLASDWLINGYYGGRRVWQNALTLPPGESVDRSFRVEDLPSGFSSGYAALADDRMMGDNRVYFHRFAPPRIRTLLVGKDDELFLRLAIQPASNYATAVELAACSSERLTPTMFDDHDVVILNNVGSMGPGVASALRAFVERGGGLLVFPGERCDKHAYTESLLNPLQLGQWSGWTESAGIEFSGVDFSHPLIAGMFEPGRVPGDRRLDSPRIRRSLKFAPNDYRTLITLSDRSPFLTEFIRKRGIVLLFSVPADLKASNFPIKGIFAPLINRSIRYAYSRHRSEDGFVCGDAVELEVRSVQPDQVRVLDPDGNKIIPRLRVIGPTVVMSMSAVNTPGTYAVQDPTGTIDLFDVNVPESESDPRIAGEDDLRALLPEQTGSIVDGEQDLEATILQSRYGREWWQWLLGLVALLAAAELVVGQTPELPGRFLRRRRPSS
jgi:hypothetical protein